MATTAPNRSPDACEDSIEDQFKEVFTKGIRLDPRDPASESFLAGLDGSITPSLDASGISLFNGRMIISSNDTELDSVSKLDFKNLYSECMEAQETFFQTFKNLTAERGLDVEENSAFLKAETLKTLPDVQNIIEDTRRHLQQRAKTKEDNASHLDRVLGAFKKQAPNIEAFFGLLPSGGEYTSIICGGISIIIKAIDKYNKMDKMVCQGLDDIRSAMADNAYATKIHKHDPEIHRCLSGVCAAIFGVLGYTLKWTHQGRAKKFFESLLKPETYGEEFGELLSKLRVAKESLLQRARILSDERDHAAAQTTQEGKKYSIHHTHMLSDIYNLLLCHKGQLEYIFQHSRRRAERSNRKRLEAKLAPFNVDEVLAQLGFKRDLLQTDCASILRRSRPDRDEQSKVAELTSDIRLRAFVETRASTVLFLQGAGAEKPRSAVSHVSAAIVEALRQAGGPDRGIYVLAHFCGEHRDKLQPFSTPLDLIITLILQFIDQCRQLDPRVLAAARIVESCKNPEVGVEDLCNILGGMMGALPDDAILFCLLDGISFFDCAARSDDMRVVVSFLLQEARERGHEARGAKVKVLFTTPSRSLGFSGIFESYETYTLRRNFHSTTDTLLPRMARGRSSFNDSVAALSDSEAM